MMTNVKFKANSIKTPREKKNANMDSYNGVVKMETIVCTFIKTTKYYSSKALGLKKVSY